MGQFFQKDIAGNNRSNFNVGYKNRISADFFYGYPVGLWDIPSDSHFELDLNATLSTNPTLAPVLGSCTFRVEAYFVEKAAYVDLLRNNDRVPLDRDVPFPYLSIGPGYSGFSPRCGILEYLQMLPAGFSRSMWSNAAGAVSMPVLNAIPLLMYYDILRNYYINPQDDYAPIRDTAYIPLIAEAPIPARDQYVSRANLDMFFKEVRSTQSRGLYNVQTAFGSTNGTLLSPFATPSSDFPSEVDHQKYMHHGLWRRTYNNDFFTSYVSNENVELMKSHANVAIKTINDIQVVNVEQISLANRNWRIATRSMLWGTDWKDYNKVHYGVNLMIPYGKPQFLGSLKSKIRFTDVISNAQTGPNGSGNDGASPIQSNMNLGSRAAIAFGGLGNGDRKFVEFNTKDEGYLMLIATIVPDVDYYQGIDPMYMKTNLKHSWMVELNSVGMQDFHRAWMSVVPFEVANGVPPENTSTISWGAWNVAEHKVPIWFEYMAKYNQLHGLFTGANQLRYWTFARPFTDLQTLFDTDFELDNYEPYTSTYGMPEMFHYIFADALTDNFQLQFNFDARLNCMLDKQVIAYL
ncbi:MAG: hypothetical protein J6Q07_01270 [Alistipes sp.]|nr:hypothetical protein [Alistipes sp.]